MNFKQKYYKYKQKYTSLLINGGNDGPIKNINPHDNFEKFVESKYFNKYDINFDDLLYTDMQLFFKKLLNLKNNKMLPDTIDEENYVGKTNFTKDDIKKFWHGLDPKPENNSTSRLSNKYIADKSNNYEIISDFIQIEKLQDDQYIGTFDKIHEMFEKKLTMYNNMKDVSQLSGIIGYHSHYLHDEKYYNEILSKIKKYKSFDASNDIYVEKTTQDIIFNKNIIFKYYHDKCMLFEIQKIITFGENNNDNIEFKMWMYNVEFNKKNNVCKVFPFMNQDIMLNDKYEKAIINIFDSIKNKLNNITQSTDYKILPDNFFHIHVSEFNDDSYVLLTLHTLYENTTSHNNDINYVYKDDNDHDHNIFRSKKLDDIDNNVILEMMKKHSYYVLFNINDNKHYLYQINNANKLFIENNSKSIGIKSTFMSNQLIDINHINNRGVIISFQNRKCDSVCSLDSKDFIPIEFKDYKNNNMKLYFYYKDDGYIIVNENAKQCASIKISNAGKGRHKFHQKYIFIDDIKVSPEFNECYTSFFDILNGIKGFAKHKQIDFITLDDDSYMQFPDIYNSSHNAIYFWRVAYLKKDPKKSSLYCNYDFKMLNDKRITKDINLFLNFIVDDYNVKNTFDLVDSGKKLQNKLNDIIKNKENNNFINSVEYIEFKKEYDNFYIHITKKMREMIYAYFDILRTNGTESLLEEIFIDLPYLYVVENNMIKITGINEKTKTLEIKQFFDVKLDNYDIDEINNKLKDIKDNNDQYNQYNQLFSENGLIIKELHKYTYNDIIKYFDMDSYKMNVK